MRIEFRDERTELHPTFINISTDHVIRTCRQLSLWQMSCLEILWILVRSLGLLSLVVLLFTVNALLNRQLYKIPERVQNVFIFLMEKSSFQPFSQWHFDNLQSSYCCRTGVWKDYQEAKKSNAEWGKRTVRINQLAYNQFPVLLCFRKISNNTKTNLLNLLKE